MIKRPQDTYHVQKVSNFPPPRLQCYYQRAWKEQSLGKRCVFFVWFDACSETLSRCYQLQCHDQRLWKGWTVASSIEDLWGYEGIHAGPRYNYLQRGNSELCEWCCVVSRIEFIWTYAASKCATKHHLLQWSHRGLCQKWPMGGGVALFTDHGWCNGVAKQHQLQCSHQCLWEGRAVAAGSTTSWCDADVKVASRPYQLQCWNQCLCNMWLGLRWHSQELRSEEVTKAQPYRAGKYGGFHTHPYPKWMVCNRQSGWWFGCHEFYFPRNIGLLIIPIDEIIFFRGVAQPPTRNSLNMDSTWMYPVDLP